MHTGFNVPVADVENVLIRHPQVAEIALIGIPDEAVVERVCAVVVPAGDPPELSELIDYLRDAGVGDLYLPEFLKLVETLPRTATGKVRKVELRERFTEA